MADENGIRHSHDVIDDDPHFKIDAATREITRTSEAEPVLIKYDHNSERFTFEMPRLIDGHDMTLCNKVEVNFINTEATNIKNTYGSKYPVDDLAPVDGDDDTLVFTWLISGAATGLVGPLAFAISFACTVDTTDENGEVATETTYRWNTKPYVGVVITDGLETQELMNENYYDYVDEWANTIEQTGVTSVGAVEHAESVAVGNIAATVVNAETASIKKIDDHVAEVVEDTRKELAASALDAKDILVQTTGQATDKIMSQKATTDALDANFSNLSAADAALESALRSEIAVLNRNVVDLERCVLLYRGEPTVDGDETVPPEPYTAAEGIEYAVYNEASNVDDGYHQNFIVRTIVEYCPVSSYGGGNPTATPIVRRSIDINTVFSVISDPYSPSSEPSNWVRQDDGTLCIKLPEYDKYGNGVLTMRFLDCYMSYTEYGAVTDTRPAYIVLNVVYELDGERKTLVVPVCECYIGYEHVTAGKVISSPPKLIEYSYEIDTAGAAAYEVYRIKGFLDGDTVSYTVNANNIASIKRTKTEGLVDTYTVMFDDGKTTTFTVTNGRAITSIEKTDTINDEDIYTVYFNDGTTMTFTVPNVEANRSYIEDNVEDLRMILEEFGATTTEQANGLVGVIDVPERVSKYARLNSFGGMSRKVAVPTAQGYNLLPFPYAGNNFGSDGAGTFAFTGLAADSYTAVFINELNPWTVPITLEGKWYKFKVWTTNRASQVYVHVCYTNGDGEEVLIDGYTGMHTDIVESEDGSGYEIVCYLEPGTTVTRFLYMYEGGDDISSYTCSGGIYEGLYISSDLDPNDPNSYSFYDSEWIPRVASYKLEHTKLQAIKSVGANLWGATWMSGQLDKNGTYVSSATGFCSDFVAVSHGSTYTIRRTIATQHINVRLYDKDKNYLGIGSESFYSLVRGSVVGNPMSANRYSCVITITNSDVAFIRINDMSGDSTTQYSMYLGNYAEADIPEYTPYVEHVYTIPTDIPTLDGFVADDGTIYQDVVDVKNRKYMPKVHTAIFTGNELWKQATTHSDTHVFSLYAQHVDKDGKAVAMITGVCNEYPTTTRTSQFGQVNGIYMATSASYIITDMGCATLSEFTAKLKSRYAAGNPVVAKCVLRTDIEDPTDLPTRLDKLIPIEPNGHLIAVTDTGEGVPLDVEITVIGPNINDVLDEINLALETLLNGGS